MTSLFEIKNWCELYKGTLRISFQKRLINLVMITQVEEKIEQLQDVLLHCSLSKLLFKCYSLVKCIQEDLNTEDKTAESFLSYCNVEIPPAVNLIWELIS